MLLLIISLVLVLLPLEIILQKTEPNIKPIKLSPDSPHSAYMFSDNPRLGYVLKSNFRNDEPDLHETFAYTNAHGQRDIERSKNKSKNTKRIIILGDSVVIGHGIKNIEDTITRQLEKLLTNYNIEVLNFGFGGYATRAEIEILKTKAIEFNPDLTILLYTSNDLSGINSQLYHYIAPEISLYEKLSMNCALIRLINRALGISNKSKNLQRHYSVMPNNPAEESMEIFKDLAKKNSFTPCVLLWPDFSKTQIKTNMEYMHPIINASQKHNIRFWDLTPYILKHLEEHQKNSPLRKLTIGDTMHPNKTGAYVAAKAIKDLLVQNFTKELNINI